MAIRFLEITQDTKVRLGFYNDLPPNPVEARLIAWYCQEGDTIGGEEDPNSGSLKGADIVRIESEKGGIDIEAVGWEIGAKIVRILIPEETDFTYDLRYGSLRLAELEIPDEADSFEHVSPHEPQMPADSTALKDDIRVSPLARLAAEESGILIDQITASQEADAQELTEETVRAFVSRQNSKDIPIVGQTVRAAPATRQLAKSLGVDLSTVQSSHPEGIVLRGDVERSVRPSFDSVEPVASQEADPFEIMFPSMRRIATARHMAESWKYIPHASPGIDINPGPLIHLRASMKERFEQIHGVALRLDHFFVAACARLLVQKEFRILNACWHEGADNTKPQVRLWKHANIGIAVGVPPSKTKSGFSELVVPVVHNAETLTFEEIVQEAERLVVAASNGNPDMQDLQDKTFIVNNTGSPVEWHSMRFAGDEFPDPIMAPETSAILAFGATRKEGADLRMRLTLKFDHRVCDGYEPKLFMRALQYLLEHPEGLVVLK